MSVFIKNSKNKIKNLKSFIQEKPGKWLLNKKEYIFDNFIKNVDISFYHFSKKVKKIYKFIEN